MLKYLLSTKDGRKAAIKFALLAFIVVGLPALAIILRPDILNIFRSVDRLREFFAEYQGHGFVIYVALQVIAIVVTLLPQQFLQLAAGYFFGIGPTIILSIIGMLLGSLLSYYLAKLLGKDFVVRIVGERNYYHYAGFLQGKGGKIATAIVYLIPGFPKDIFAYVAGIANVKLWPFLFISTAARMPGVLVSIFAGKFFADRSWGFLIALGAVFVVFAGVLFLNRNKIIEYFTKRRK